PDEWMMTTFFLRVVLSDSLSELEVELEESESGSEAALLSLCVPRRCLLSPLASLLESGSESESEVESDSDSVSDSERSAACIVKYVHVGDL
ncbi:hypothetical protein KEM52_002988, partial [Ascosphaera acerosa]